MQAPCIDEHLATLKRRYGGRLLREAAARRAHLDYRSVSMGDGRGTARVRFLLAQMHQAYYFGWTESACILAGTVLEQALILRLERQMEERGPLVSTRSGERRWLASRHDLLDLELVEMLDLARGEGILREGRHLLAAHEIRWIRNMVVHDRVPVFRPVEGGGARDGSPRESGLVMTVAKSRKNTVKYATIRLDPGEVEGLAGAPAELTGYYCVSRVRTILGALFPSERREAAKHDESGGGLLLWQEQ
jgi:hypothetical protein